MALILALESSCDDSAAALVTSDRQILAQAVVGQNEAHRPFGGVVPEIAARAHVEILPGLVRQVLHEADISIGEVDAIAATAGPGLIGGVMVGLLTGKGLALAAGKPLIAVNHLEGHALSPRLVDRDLDFPYLLLLASGGHCQLLEVAGSATTAASRRRSTMPRAKRSTRPPSCWAWAIPAARRSSRSPPRATRARFRCRARSSGSKEPHFSFAGLKAAVQRAVASGNMPTPTSPRASSKRWSTASSTAPGARWRSATRRRLVVAGGVAANARCAARSSSLAAEQGRAFSVPPAGCAPTMRR